MPFQISILAFFVFYNDASIFQTSYERDSLGRITILTEVSQGNTVVKQYSYDITGRLWKVLKNDTLISTYTYDANGNRIARSTPTTVDSGSYDAQDRMLKYGNAQYIYTKNGELLKKVIGNDTTSYAYDYLGNLVTVLLPSGDQIDYIIDGQNRRVGKKLNGNLVKRWVYSSGLLPIAELDSAGNVMAQFVGNMMYKNGNTYQLITDHLGSVRLVVDKNTGDIAQQMEYDEFGNVLSDLNPEFQPLGYAGGMYDNQTKLVRFGARDYDASVGRWTCKDPIGFGRGETGLYGYVGNDPINWIDLSGLVKKGYIVNHIIQNKLRNAAKEHGVDLSSDAAETLRIEMTEDEYDKLASGKLTDEQSTSILSDIANRIIRETEGQYASSIKEELKGIINTFSKCKVNK